MFQSTTHSKLYMDGILYKLYINTNTIDNRHW